MNDEKKLLFMPNKQLGDVRAGLTRSYRAKQHALSIVEIMKAMIVSVVYNSYKMTGAAAKRTVAPLRSPNFGSAGVGCPLSSYSSSEMCVCVATEMCS